VTTYKFLKCWYTNADSLSSKFNELQSRPTIDKTDIVVIIEVNCKLKRGIPRGFPRVSETPFVNGFDFGSYKIDIF